MGSLRGSKAITRLTPPSTIKEAIPYPAAPSPSWPTCASQLDAGVPAGRDHRGHRHDRGSVDVVVHYRLRQRLDQAAFDLEAFGRRDVLEVNPAECRRDPNDCVDELSTSVVSIRIGMAERPANCR